MNEIWKDIEGYEGLYQVSNMGRVKSLEKNIIKCRGGLYKIEEKILKSIKNKKGYLLISLCKDGKKKSYHIHRLVASAFIDNQNNLPQVNHINEDKTDNRVDNLEWCTAQYNNNFGTHNEKMAKTLSIPVLQFTLDGELVKKWNGSREIERELGFDNRNISKCCKGKYKSAYGYRWYYHYKSLWEKKHVPLIKRKKVA